MCGGRADFLYHVSLLMMVLVWQGLDGLLFKIRRRTRKGKREGIHPDRGHVSVHDESCRWLMRACGLPSKGGRTRGHRIVTGSPCTVQGSRVRIHSWPPSSRVMLANPAVPASRPVRVLAFASASA